MVKKKKKLKRKTVLKKGKSIRKSSKKAKKKKSIRKSKKRDLNIFELADGYEDGTLTRKQEMEFWYHVNRGDIDHPDDNKIWDVDTQTWKNKESFAQKFIMGCFTICALVGFFYIVGLVQYG